MFRYYAYEFDYESHVVSLNQQRMLKRDKWACSVPWRLSIEDPVDTTHDVGRVIFCVQGQRLIREEFQRGFALLCQGGSISMLCLPRRKECYLCQKMGHTPRECNIESFKASKGLF